MIKQGVVVDACAGCSGIWLDKDEINKLPASRKNNIDIELEQGLGDSKVKEEPASSRRLPNLSLTSAVTLVFLYGALSLILISLVHFEIMSAGFAMIFQQTLVFPARV